VANNFDEWTKTFAGGGGSRRDALRWVGSTVSAALLARFGFTRVFAQSNSDCAQFCDSIFPPGPLRGQCKSNAAHMMGICFACGPSAPVGHGPVCGPQGNPVCCMPGESCCGSVCTNLRVDQLNCGVCGRVCPTGTICLNGMCIACPSGTTVCDGLCVDLANDPVNCGSCGKVCPNSAPFCVGGTCSCPLGFISCNGTCVNTATDVRNCGSCGVACANGSVCFDGTCVLTCPPGSTNCSRGCVDTAIDAFNCGACGNVCSTGLCVSGSCVCPTGLTNCHGTCSNLATDPTNCGTCGHVCPVGTACVNGVCVGVGCSSDVDCPQGMHCVNGVCVGCTPTTCVAQGKNCGSIPDGCGGALSCGMCTSPMTCGGGGVANVCG
jgi:hypothetical protein